MSTHPRLLTIHDLFLKASSSPSTAKASDQQQSDILSFVGQVAHSISSSQISRLLAAKQDQELLDQQLDRLPLHSDALSTFKARGDGSLPDKIVWLVPLQTVPDDPVAHCTRRAASRRASTTRPTPAISKNLKERNKQDSVVVVLDSGDEAEKQKPLTETDEHPPQPSNNKQEVDNGATSCVSWSDSNVSRSEAEEHFEDALTMTMVALLLHTASQQDGPSSSRPFKRGDVVEVTDALMLQQELACYRVVTCVGITDTTFYRISPAHQSLRTKLPDVQIPVRRQSGPPKKPFSTTAPTREKTKEQKRSRSDSVPTCEKGLTPSKARKKSRSGTVLTCEKGSTPSGARKRSRSGDAVLDGDSDEGVVLIPESSKDKKRTRRDEQGVNNSPTQLPKPWSHQALNSGDLDPLKFHAPAQKWKRILDSRISRSGSCNRVDYICNVWCSLPTAPSSATSISGTPSSSDGTTGSTTGSDTITRHICRINTIQRVQIRAVCAECENDYRSQMCMFGCSSRRWRTQVEMECTISDGTSVAELRLGSDQEAVMWTLLGLKEASRDRSVSVTGKDSVTSVVGGDGRDNVDKVAAQPADLHEEHRNKVLRILARRGNLTFKSGPAPDLTSSSSSRSLLPNKEKAAVAVVPQKGHVESIDLDRSQRATTEEKLWLDICTVHPRKQQSFVLYATTSPMEENGSTPSQSALSRGAAKRRTVLRKSRVQIQKRKKIESLVRPPLILWAVAAEWIRPHSETKMLLSRLLPQQQHQQQQQPS
ncbi:hypothetical protein KI688_008036 [Linnemannia hyalina]|uniref:Uncharacterized protein n=1 Tax=Linnemannia hyalina TaxID=64524 RepID=A0A9P7Y284_9FUNG|nr:hypothetical protein KI688_008036 [Linnemannia hyalina]